MTVLITHVRTTLRVSIKLIITHAIAWLDSLDIYVKQVNRFIVEKEYLLRECMRSRKNEIDSIHNFWSDYMYKTYLKNY